MTDTKTKYPSAVYAAAGVGDFVYEQLRKLQNKAVAFGSEAGAQAPEWKKKVADLSAKVDANKVRDSVVTGTQVVAEKATEVYSTLVNRGEKAFAAQQAPKTTPTAAPTASPKAETAAPKTPATAAGTATAAKAQPAAAKASTAAPVAPAKKAAAPRKKAE